MPIKKTYYEILGVSRAATQEQIKRRYRLLVRKYHPDVADDKVAAQKAFIEIKDAYETLSNPNKRSIYDAKIDAEMFNVPPRSSSSTSHGPDFGRDVRRPHTRTTGESQHSLAEKLIREAQLAFIQGDLNRVIVLGNEAKRIDPTSVKAHIILGDVYKARKRMDEAIAMYTMAAQLDPRNAEVRVKLDQLMRGGVGNDDERFAALRVGVTLIGISAMILLFAILAMNPGEPIIWR